MTTPTAHASGLEPGLPGFSFADLQEPRRLKDLYGDFCRQVAADDPALWNEWAAYRDDPGAPRPAAAVSGLLVRMAAHVSRFVARLFRSRGRMPGAVSPTRAARPALPLQGRSRPSPRAAAEEDRGAGISASARLRRTGDCRRPTTNAWWPRSWRATPTRSTPSRQPPARCSTARRRCRRTLRVPSARRFSRSSTALARWTAAHLDDPACAGWVSFRLPHPIEPFEPRGGGPSSTRRSRSSPSGRSVTGAAATASRSPTRRMDRREVLCEIHYCVLCHERDKDSCSKGIRDEGRQHVAATRSASRWPAARSTRRSPRCTAAEVAATRSARWRWSRSTTRCAPAPATASATTA